MILTWEVPSEAGLGSDHPLCSGLTEDGHGAFRLQPQGCQSTAKLTDQGVHILIGQPPILPQDQLEGRRVSH